MKKLIGTLVLVLCVCAPAIADRPVELAGSLAYTDNRTTDVQAGQLDLQVDFPLGAHLQGAPVVSYAFIDPAEGDKVSVISYGVAGTFNFSKKADGVFLAAKIVKPTEDAKGYVVTPEIGFKKGNDGGFFRAGLSRPYHTDEGEEISLDALNLNVGIGYRF